MQGVRARIEGWTTAGTAAVLAIALGLLAPTALYAGSAGYTTTTGGEGSNAQDFGCLGGPNGVDCNNYSAKDAVYMSGGASTGAGLPDGQYFFAVLVPGHQNGGFVDGAAGNLSDTTAGGTAGDGGNGDDVSNRTFTLSGGEISAYSGSHTMGISPQGRAVIQLMPYDDTSNEGGVYILAICEAGATSSSQCKYDAFRIKPPACDVCPCPGVSDCGGTLPLAVVKNATPTFDRKYTWQIQKDVDKTEIDVASGSATFNYTVTVTHDGGTDQGWKVGGTITVLNPNGFDATGVVVTDAIANEPNATCGVTGGSNVTVPANGSVDLAYECTYSQAPAASTETNTASAVWTPPGATDPLTATFDIAFTFPSTPTNEIDECVDVTDSQAGALGQVCVGDSNPKAFNYSKSYSSAAGTCTNTDNTATFTTNDTGATGSASKTVKVCTGADLTVSKTATPGFLRTYTWFIDKQVTPTLVDQQGGTALFSYTVTAYETGFSDSLWSVTGSITVSNPNAWQSITANVTDAVNDGGVCAVTGGSGVTIAAGTSKVLSYSCSYAAAPSPASGTNTATATVTSGVVPNTTPQGSANFAFGSPTATTNKTITVTDAFNGGTPTTLGTLTATDTAPFASATYQYSRSIAVLPNCAKYPNTATIVETGQNSSQLVEVCGPAKTGALTMGFWQNKNGQAILTGGASVSNVCKSGTWLRSFAPFQDLSATATCTQVAAYVTNVIKAANASGAAMNAMLKGQMLATSLDVYFSDPALGGNKISSPSPVGGFDIDLKKICKMIDSSSGTATCSGVYEDVSVAFGGATHMLVLGMITYSSGQSNVGGSIWYGQVKATQGLAKDAFDAINNGVAFPAP